MTDTRASLETISMLREPAAAERTLLSLLGPADTRIMQEYDDSGLRKNLAHHALSVSDCPQDFITFTISVLI